MKEVERSSVYKEWFSELKDSKTRMIIDKRIDRLQNGNAGDHKHIVANIFELRIHYGAGYRVYYQDTGKEIIILLCGGDKGTQQRDIDKAKDIAKQYKE
jgi:putative addiction module killer protein